jgi:hypothetical protein
VPRVEGAKRTTTGPQAAAACEDIKARDYNVGNHLAFNSGEYDPSSAEGQHVLAHELAHVRQQTGGALSMLPQVGVEMEIDPDPALEREAEETAERVMNGEELGIQRLGQTAVHVQRAKDWVPEEQSNDGDSTQSRINVEFDEQQIQKKFKHADDFGVNGNWSSQNKKEFEQALEDHVQDPDTVSISGTYRGKQVVHLYNTRTKNNMIVSESGEFISAWKLSKDQQTYLTTSGDL